MNILNKQKKTKINLDCTKTNSGNLKQKKYLKILKKRQNTKIIKKGFFKPAILQHMHEFSKKNYFKY
jgi:hypothetical protein